MNPKNPLGLRGISFVEFASQDFSALEELFHRFGFKNTFRHKTKNIFQYNQGQIRIFLNNEKESFAKDFTKAHGPCLPSMGWRVEDSDLAFKEAIRRGATPAPKQDYEGIPALMGIGTSLIYLMDDKHENQMGFTLPQEDPGYKGDLGFETIDHLTNNVPKGTMEEWTRFYKDIFGFEEIRYFDIKGIKTGLTSYALRSPCGCFAIPINEGTEDKSQINEYLRDYKGAGVQHLAFTTNNMIQTVMALGQAGIQTLDIEDEYYGDVFQRLPQVTEDRKKLKDLNILVDGDRDGYLLQIFTKNVIGPIFMEIIQRKNHFSFGEGNFGALFRSIEKDQEKRGVL
jgi:4-hydroxyphenylpyruvate dioxygenase